MLNRKGMTREELRVKAGITTNAIKGMIKILEKFKKILKKYRQIVLLMLR